MVLVPGPWSRSIPEDNAWTVDSNLSSQPINPLQEGAPKNPRAVAEAILANLAPSPLISETSLAGPGFINVRVSLDWLGDHVRAMLNDGVGTWAPKLPYGRVIVDFSSPNVAKEMHVGHLRSTIIGDTIARTLEYCNCDVLRLNHIVSVGRGWTSWQTLALGRPV